MTSPASKPSRRREAGFTLIELLVVLLVLALTATLVLGRGSARSPTLDLRSAVGEIAQGLRLARSLAIARNRKVTFTLDVASGGYRIGDAPARSLPAGIALSITAVAENTGGGRLGAIEFMPDGSSSGGRVAVVAGGRRAWVGVDWLTGRVSMLDAP